MGMRYFVERWSASRLDRKRFCRRLCSSEGTKPGQQIRALAAAAFCRRHRRALLLCDLCDLIVREQMKASAKILNLDVVPALVTGKALDGSAILQSNTHSVVSGADLRRRPSNRSFNLRDSHFPSNTRKVRTDRRPAAQCHVARATSALAQ